MVLLSRESLATFLGNIDAGLGFPENRIECCDLGYSATAVPLAALSTTYTDNAQGGSMVYNRIAAP